MVRGGQRVRNGLPPQAGPLIKAGRPQVQERDQFWLARMQTSQQGLSKEIMVPIPLPLLIQRHDKEIGSLHLFEHLLTCFSRRTCGDGLTGGCIHARDHARLEQKGLKRNRQPRENVLLDVV